ncbi:hypothetical protein [Pelagimonas varians]|uniref:Uncharacterized protein n=1 Tax=Pelagimonas varians TaxID=696760 RepID=A0A238KFW0_9RHOB|nr:hypothetical protein [Pelagimonas varians]PYG32413.1 hypothetical protein C8N36_103162 [Pelagimonas varians]SMX41404.1 hypothetical protein PEV8663_02268 [Pelagimonas varians]
MRWLEPHAKAIAAFAVPPLAILALAVLVRGFSMPVVALSLIFGFWTSAFTAAAVWWVPNRVNGYSVSYIASMLIDRGIAPAGKPKRFDDG